MLIAIAVFGSNTSAVFFSVGAKSLKKLPTTV